MLDQFKNKKVVITGNTGFKGSWLSAWLVKLGAEVYGISKNVPTDPSHFKVAQINKKVNFIRLNICDYKSLEYTLKKIKPDYVFHLAAQALVKESYDNPKLTFETNTIGSLNILECIKDFTHKCSIVMITSDKCYENVEQKKGYLEDDRLGGKDPYSASKAGAELVIKSYFNSYISHIPNIRLAIARAGNVIGGGDWSNDRIIPDAVKAWSSNNKLQIRNPNSTRPWQHVLEPVSGYLLLAVKLKKNKKINGEAFNFGPKKNENYKVIDVLNEFKKYWPSANWTKEKGYRKFYESSLLSLDCSKAKSILGWESKLTFKQNIKMTSEWYQSYYNNRINMWNITIDQINKYEKLISKIENDKKLIDGLIVKNLDIINHKSGNIFRGLKKNESSYKGFGELYFSAINYLDIKGWKKHKEMTMNLISVSGEIKLVIYDDRNSSSTKGNFFETNLSIFKNFQRVSVPPNVWFGFKVLVKN